MHYEVELGLIMGKTVRDLHPEDTKGAMDAIEGTISFVFSYLLLAASLTCTNLSADLRP
jgi:hypothetical protein